MFRPLVAASLGLALSACNAASSSFSGGIAPPLQRMHDAASSGKIQHVVIIVQENRSFNNLLYGFPGAKTVRSGLDSKNQKIELRPVPLEAQWDLDHSSQAFFSACNGTGKIPGTHCRMNGFDKEWAGCGSGYGVPCIKHPQYAYVPQSETKPYFELGEEYVVGDQMYASNFDASSFVSHQYIIAGQAEASVNYPYGAWGCEGGSGNRVATVGKERQIPERYIEPCYNDATLGEEADDAGVSWAFYTSAIAGDGGIWSAYQANKRVYYGNDWKNDIIMPQAHFFTDVKKGRLRQITWITPTCENSDHAGCESKTGPSWVASLVNAIGESKYWKNTAIFIFWDDYGGWYDPEAPEYVDYDGLGMRIPLIIVSPYAKEGYVSHVHYEHGSILKFVENVFGLPRLAESDKRAVSPERDCFDFGKPPRRFKEIPAEYSRYYFLHQPPDLRPPDTN